MKFYIEIRDLLICCALGEGEPGSGRLVVDAYLHSAECREILCYRDKMLIGNVRINGQGKYDVLSVGAYLAHISERLVRQVAVYAALIGEIIVVGVIPREGHLLITARLAYTLRPFLVQRIIAVH